MPIEYQRCSIHGDYIDDAGDGCYECQQELKAAEENRDDALRESREREQREDERRERESKKAEERAHRVNNPGDFDCPACMMTTLKRGATRCPKCTELVSANYWAAVEAREAEAVRRREEALKRREDDERRRELEILRAREAHEVYLRSPQGLAAAAAEAARKAEAERRYVARCKAARTTGTVLGILLGIPAGLFGAMLLLFVAYFVTCGAVDHVKGLPFFLVLLAGATVGSVRVTASLREGFVKKVKKPE